MVLDRGDEAGRWKRLIVGRQRYDHHADDARRLRVAERIRAEVAKRDGLRARDFRRRGAREVLKVLEGDGASTVSQDAWRTRQECDGRFSVGAAIGRLEVDCLLD